MLDPLNVFNIFRKDRQEGKIGGGVCIMVKKNISVVQFDLPSCYSILECLCVDVYIKHRVFRLFNVYRPCGSTAIDVVYMKCLIDCLSTHYLNDCINVWLGDFNCPNICWSTYNCNGNLLEKDFLQLIIDSAMYQFVTQATRGDNILDVIFCNNPMFIVDTQIAMPVGSSDHCSVSCNFNLSICLSQCQYSTPCNDDLINVRSSSVRDLAWKKANWTLIENFIRDIDWSSILSGCITSDEIYSSFLEVINIALLNFTPLVKKKLMCRKKLNHKVPRKVRKLYTAKAKLWKKYKSNKSVLNRKKYIATSAKAKKAVINSVKTIEHKILRTGNSRNFFNYIGSQMKTTTTKIGPIKDQYGGLAGSCFEKANLFNNYFVGACSIDNGTIPPLSGVKDSLLNESSTVEFTECKIYKILRKEKSTLSAGPDDLPPLLFKNLAKCLARPLCIVFKLIFNIGTLPTLWKHAIVSPIFKKGNCTLVENYRPISLTCVPCKIFEHVVKDSLLLHLRTNNILNKMQHGFLSGHSTCTNLLEALNDWTNSLKNGYGTRIVFIDLKRAFDTVCQNKLIFKLLNAGINGKLLDILSSFLLNRTQCVVINDIISETKMLTSGVPQGSVLGPLLFIFYLNDICSSLCENTTLNCFADDAKLYKEIRSNDDIVSLQTDLTNLVTWTSDWQLQISVEKCAILHVKPDNIFDSNEINDVTIEMCLNKIDLGIGIDKCLNFSAHIHSIVSRSRQRINLLFRAFKTRNIAYLLRGFNAYVLPIVSYCSPVWSPYKVSDILQIESVLRLFTRRLPGFESLPYGKRLAELNLQTLERRRLHADLILCFKLVTGVCDRPLKNYGLHLIDLPRSTRGHDLKFDLTHCRIDSRLYFFGPRVAKVWNCLPYEIVHSPSVQAFKQSISKLDLSKFLILNFVF